MTSQGDTVLAKLPDVSVEVEVAGPIVPGEGLPKVTSATTCTWTATLRGATTPMAISISDFTTIDGLGHRYQLQLVPGQPRPPRTLDPGQRVTFELRTVMATGEGVMQWAPGGQVLGVWDFVVEND